MRVIYDVFRDGLEAINAAAGQLARAREQVSTGRRVNAPSDDPLALRQAVTEHANIGAVDAYSRSRDSAATRLAVADNVLSTITDKLTAAVVAGTSAQGSTATAAARVATAQQIRGLRESLVADFNTTFNGNYLFSGTAANTPAYAQVAGQWTYQGNTDTTEVEVERGRLVSVSFDGQALAQGTDAKNVLTALDDLATAIEAGDSSAMGTEIDALERAFGRTQRALGSLGADSAGLDEARARLSALRVAAETRRASLEDANMADAITRLSKADTAYQAALAAVSTAERRSLLDYLR
jgi:flagellar hook-associated protein 3 FlgL